MTWRAFIIGLFAVVAFSLLDPYTSFIKSYGWLTASCFPGSAVLALVVLTVGANTLLRCIRRAWELSQPELMLIWCMLIVGAVIPCEGIGRYWYSLLAGPPYMARRSDYTWEDAGSLALAPDGLLLSKDPKSMAAQQYYEGAGETGRIPWRAWLRPLAHWAVFLVFMYMAVFFLCGVLRRQWVDVERLMFPLARVPLEFSESAAEAGSSARSWLPSAFTNRAFLMGVVFSAAFRFVRALPLFFGSEQGMPLSIPIGDVFRETPLQYADFLNFEFWPIVVGFAFLVPADVSLSVWFFFMFSRGELYVAHEMAWPRAWGTWSPFVQWQQVGAYVAFALGMAVMARRQLWAVVLRGIGLAQRLSDADEPIGYRLAFWGFVVSIMGCLAWYAYHGMGLLTAVAVLALLFCSSFVYARIVAQGGAVRQPHGLGAGGRGPRCERGPRVQRRRCSHSHDAGVPAADGSHEYARPDGDERLSHLVRVPEAAASPVAGLDRCARGSDPMHDVHGADAGLQGRGHQLQRHVVRVGRGAVGLRECGPHDQAADPVGGAVLRARHLRGRHDGARDVHARPVLLVANPPHRPAHL